MITTNSRGFTLLIAVITVSIVLAMGMSILNITLKQFLLSGSARDSEVAFYAADAGYECVRYWDQSTNGGKFNITNSGTQNVTCFGSTEVVSGFGSGATHNLQYEWTGPGGSLVCTRVVLTKTSCGSGAVCTDLESSGYNRGCSAIGSDPRVVERTLHSSY